MLCRGYLGDVEFPVDEEGFFRTGDLGRLDSAGQLVVTGRIKDIIIRKGENISAKEIEDLLGAHPGIAEVAVVGLPDSERGERCCAIVVLKPGIGSLGLGDITTYCDEAGLMRFKHPEQLEQMDALPRNSTGKILKKDLRQRLSEGESTWTTATTTRTTT
jgi:non-ribosomal peptide synthetase component E (peptide arylation enzyme)